MENFCVALSRYFPRRYNTQVQILQKYLLKIVFSVKTYVNMTKCTHFSNTNLQIITLTEK